MIWGQNLKPVVSPIVNATMKVVVLALIPDIAVEFGIHAGFFIGLRLPERLHRVVAVFDQQFPDFTE